jgi:uncharacterized protein (TIGR03790 family)
MNLHGLRSGLLTFPVLLALGGVLAMATVHAATEVVVIYNSRVPESKEVAEYYALKRQVPKEQVFGFELPTGESMSRKDFLEGLHDPLLKKLEEGRLLVFSPATNKPPGTPADFKPFRRVVEARIRYAALCYGVPVKILKDPGLVEDIAANVQPELRRNEAAVDTQLALLPISDQKLPWSGPLPNPFYNLTNAAAFDPTNGLLMVTRLDGPSAAIARGLVDKAMEAETNGLLGRAYFDARGLATNDNYRLGDDWMTGAATVAKRFGFETELDEKGPTFTAGHPFSQVALYAGWYDQTVTGPFTRPTVEFVPGAFAYHLYSFSAATIRSAKNSWVGTLLEKGATCTMGAVDEPYLSMTPDIQSFIARFTFAGFTFGEAAYAAQPGLSWQTTIVGDPLYRPFGRDLGERLKEIDKKDRRFAEWVHLMVVDRNEVMKSTPRELAGYIEAQPVHRQSAVLTEKLADLYWAAGSMGDAVDTYEVALRRGPSPQQRIRLLMKAAERRTLYGPDDKAFAHYDTLLKENPDYPDALKIYQAMLPIARRMGNKAGVERCEKEITRLSPPPATPAAK